MSHHDLHHIVNAYLTLQSSVSICRVLDAALSSDCVPKSCYGDLGRGILPQMIRALCSSVIYNVPRGTEGNHFLKQRYSHPWMSSNR